jgi:hypothetical protein
VKGGRKRRLWGLFSEPFHRAIRGRVAALAVAGAHPPAGGWLSLELNHCQDCITRCHFVSEPLPKLDSHIRRGKRQLLARRPKLVNLQSMDRRHLISAARTRRMSSKIRSIARLDDRPSSASTYQTIPGVETTASQERKAGLRFWDLRQKWAAE